MSQQELDTASRLTALLFRIINSPLRPDFFDALERTGSTVLGLLETALSRLRSASAFEATQLLSNESTDDDYWNDAVFREIPSAWLHAFLTGHAE